MPLMQCEVEHQCSENLPIQLTNKEMLIARANKILIVDDDRDLCLGLHIRLRAYSYDTCFAHDATSAVSTALSEMPDLILLDIGLPGDDGYAVLHRMSAFPQLVGIPVIVMSGRNRITHEKVAMDAGASRYLPKPIDNLRLLSGIRTLLR
ncbi:MAG TPA: response regulator [Candidatus Angelobacter sp.]|jgi:DNA-binding response OmpR family regulator|nr:response regulator [Candidatus Angelobacter sp.]